MAKNRRPSRGLLVSRPDLPVEMVDRQGELYRTYVQLNELVASGKDGDERVQLVAASTRRIIARLCKAYEPCDCTPACVTCESSSAGSRKTPARGEVCSRLCWFSSVPVVQIQMADPA